MLIKACEYCGDDLGYEDERGPGDDPIVCGKKECAHWARAEVVGAREERAERAAEDDCDRYGGGWS
jgi:hypothetical protein